MEFRTNVIRPVECFREGWELIKDQYWLFFAITLVGMILAGFIPIVGIGVMFCGIYYCLLRKLNGESVAFEDLFKGFNYFVPSLIATLVVIVPSIIAVIFIYGSMFAVLFSATNARGRIDDSAIPLLFGTMLIEGAVVSLVIGCLHALIMFAYPLIVERNLSGYDSFKTSASAVWQNLSGVVGLILCEFVLGLLGYALCGVGVYFAMPIIFAGVAVAYRKVFPPPAGFTASGNQPPAPPQFVNRSQWQ